MGLLVLAAFCIPVLAALLISPADAAEITASRIERISAVLFVLLAVFAWRTKRQIRMQPFLWFVPGILVLVHGLVYTLAARSALFLADQDITNISSAIANTATGRGLLPTAYVDTGDHGSYLGHHFAPALLVLVPFYAAFSSADHAIYPVLLNIALGAGLLLWGFIFQARRSFLLALPLLFSIPVFRLAQSFHNEVLVVLFSGLAAAGLVRQNRAMFLSGLLLWCLVKEDMPAYALLLSLYLIWQGGTVAGSYGRSFGIAGAILAALCAAAGHFLQGYFAGSTGPDWSSFLRSEWPAIHGDEFLAPRIQAALMLAASSALVPFLNLRYALFVLLPVMLLHFVSHHPWHAVYYAHYSCSILPLLFFGVLAGRQSADRIPERFRTPVFLVLFAAAMYAGAGDKKTPGAPLPADPELASARAAAARAALLPADCIHAQSHLSPLLPVSVRVLPLDPGVRNPHRGAGLDACKTRAYLLDTQEVRGPGESRELLETAARLRSQGFQEESWGRFSVFRK